MAAARQGGRSLALIVGGGMWRSGGQRVSARIDPRSTISPGFGFHEPGDRKGIDPRMNIAGQTLWDNCENPLQIMV